MVFKESSAVAEEQSPKRPPDDHIQPGAGDSYPAAARRAPLLKQYKAEQGKTIRIGSFIACAAILAWGAKFLYDQLAVYEDVEAWWALVITAGVPILIPVLCGFLTWWFVFAHRATGDFMIATEGEMKKVSWSSRREVLGSTKVVIMFTVILALLLFVIDLIFQSVFRWLNVLKVG